MSLNTDTIAGNMGFLDQLLALKWVNKYIKYFGGDNSRVTVMGNSAGANMAYMQLLSPLVKIIFYLNLFIPLTNNIFFIIVHI